MDLSEPERRERALKLLREIDFNALVSQAGRDATGANQDKQTLSDQSDRANIASPQKATKYVNQDEIHNTVSEKITQTETANSLPSLSRPISPPPPPPPPPPSLTSTTLPQSTKITNPLSTQPSTTTTTPITITLHSVSTFPSPSSSRVFYTIPHDPSSRLQVFAESIQQIFLKAGVLNPEPAGRKLTLHATVANLTYVRPDGGKGAGRGTRWRGRKGKKVGVGRIDGRDVIEYFGRRESNWYESDRGEGEEGESQGMGGKVVGLEGEEEEEIREDEKVFGYIWARDVVVDRVRICKMGATKVDDPVLGMVYPAIEKGDAEARF